MNELMVQIRCGNKSQVNDEWFSKVKVSNLMKTAWTPGQLLFYS